MPNILKLFQIQKQPQNQERNLNPNLINPNEVLSTSKSRVFQKVLKTNKTLLLLVQVVTFGLVFYSMQLSNKMEALDKNLTEYSSKVANVDDLEKKIKGVHQKIEALKKIKENYPKIASKVELIYKATPLEVQINSMSYSYGILNLNLEAAKGEEFAKLISAYLQTGEVATITLSGARLKPELGVYNFDIQVQTK